jgi:hypothetical protein
MDVMRPDDALATIGGDLPATIDPARAATPSLLELVVPTLISALHSIVGFTPAFYVTMAVVSLGPALLALPVAATAAATARRQGKADRDLGLATAAGASMGTAALTAGAVGVSLVSSVEMAMAAPLVAASALAVGVVGGSAFMAVPRSRKKDQNVPGLYQGLLSAGLGVPAIVVGGGMWSLLTWMLPFLSAAAVRAVLPAHLAMFLYPIIFLTALTPVTYAMARLWRKKVPDLNARAVGAGLMFPPLLPFLILSATLASRMHITTTLAALLVGNLVGVLPHLLAAAGGLSKRDGKRQLTSGTEVGVGLPAETTEGSPA